MSSSDADAAAGDHRRATRGRRPRRARRRRARSSIPSRPMSVMTNAARRREPAQRLVELTRPQPSVQPCTATSPSRWSSPTATVTTSRCGLDQRRDRRPPPTPSRRGRRRRRPGLRVGHVRTPPPVCTRARQRRAAAMAATTGRFCRRARPRRIEVDDVDPRRAGVDERRGDGDRVVAVDGLAGRSRPASAARPAVAQVDRRVRARPSSRPRLRSDAHEVGEQREPARRPTSPGGTASRTRCRERNAALTVPP